MYTLRQTLHSMLSMLFLCRDQYQYASDGMLQASPKAFGTVVATTSLTVVLVFVLFCCSCIGHFLSSAVW